MTIPDFIISINNLVFKYPTCWGLRSLNFEIPNGSFSVILGPNGAGKTTLMKLLIRFYHHYQGQIYLAGKELQQYHQKELAKKVGYVPQELDISYAFKVRDILLMGRYPYQSLLSVLKKEDFEQISRCMKITEIEEFYDREFNSLSGGEKKRVLIASALVQEPDILLLDEPANGLDLSHQIQIFNVLKQIQNEHKLTILMVTHDLNFAAQYGNHFIFMVNGQVVHTGDISQLANKTLMEQIYSVKFHIIEHPILKIPLILTKL